MEDQQLLVDCMIEATVQPFSESPAVILLADCDDTLSFIIKLIFFYNFVCVTLD